jgi:hypothetical protein
MISVYVRRQVDGGVASLVKVMETSVKMPVFFFAFLCADAARSSVWMVHFNPSCLLVSPLPFVPRISLSTLSLWMYLSR